MARASHGSVYHDGSVYVAGGWNRVSLASVEVLEMKSMQWRNLPSLPRAMLYPYVVSVGECVYAIDWRNSNEMYAYESSASGAWQPKSKMPDSCVWGSVATCDSRIFVLGGLEQQCMYYDDTSDSWQLMKHRPQFDHYYGTAASCEGKILLCGGLHTDQIEEYDVKEDLWSTWHIKTPYEMRLQFAIFTDKRK